MTDSATSDGLRERKRRATRTAITSAARALTSEKGLNGYTVEEVCEAAGISRRTFFNYFPAKGLLALPMSICEGGDDGRYGDKLTFSGLMVFDVSLENGIKEHGRMPFVNATQVSASWPASATCSNWWAGSTSDVKRSIFMDDYAIGISDALYQVAPLSDLGSVTRSLPLGQ